MNPPPYPPFVVGVTGNVDPTGYVDAPDHADAPEVVLLREKLRTVFRWIRSGTQRLDPQTGDLQESLRDPGEAAEDQWQGPGLAPQTPIFVLTSLAPGADTLVAEAALEFAERDQNTFVRAPLPFRLPEYEQATTFDTADKKARLARLLERLRAQPGWNEERDLFEVALDSDLAGDAFKDLTATDPATGKPRRYLRFRAAGEFIATHSDLLLAIHDPDYDCPGYEDYPDLTTDDSESAASRAWRESQSDRFKCGAVAIIEAKRNGLIYELLALANNFSWSDNGPVLRIPVRRSKNKSEMKPDGALALLHPYDCCPRRVLHDPPPARKWWQAAPHPEEDYQTAWGKRGHQVFRRILAFQEKFNQLPSVNDSESGELQRMAVPNPRPKTRAETEPPVEVGAEAGAFLQRADALARVRARAASGARELDTERGRKNRLLLGLILIAGLGLGMFEHWHHENYHHSSGGHGFFTDDPMSLLQGGLLALAVVCVVVSGWHFFIYRARQNERHRYDYRALAEGLRVQIYWCLAGTGKSVSADYMQRQRNELDWIRYAISSLSFPFVEYWRTAWMKLSPKARIQTLQVVRSKWLFSQAFQYRKRARETHEAMERDHFIAWSCAAGGLISVLLLLAAEVSTTAGPAIRQFPLFWLWALLTPGAAILAYEPLFQPRPQDDHSSEPEDFPATPGGFLVWLFRRRVWGAGLVLAAPVVGLPPWLGEITTLWPDGYNWWIILTGALLLYGALRLAGSERQLHSEHSRQYRAMRDLFVCADRRMAELLSRFHKLTPDHPQYDRLLEEIHHLLYQVGCEALDENAEWLILHRSRPLEPFMIG